MSNTKIRCKRCSHTEEFNKSLLVKIAGGATAGFGGWAWLTYFFAGTGFALPLCIAIVAGGVAMTAYADKVAKILADKYPCPKCNNRDWQVVQD